MALKDRQYEALRSTFRDPIFFQHGKVGELCERFDELYLFGVEKSQAQSLPSVE